MPGLGKLFGDGRRERVVYDEPQAKNGASDERYLPLFDRLGGVA